MNINSVDRIYFVGIGGIGMSALARYFHSLGKRVAGYDRTPGPITSKLMEEGIYVHFSEDSDEIPKEFRNSPESTLIIYTPAIPNKHGGYNYLKNNGFQIFKRSEILGQITSNYHSIAVAGTHGKTSVSTTVAHLLKQSPLDCLAFLGGISRNYSSNLILPEHPGFESKLAVVEADEFDRSFLKLSPSIALITSMDADHLDIYENKTNLVDSFNQFVKKIEPKGKIIYKKGLTLAYENMPKEHYTYSLLEEADFYAINLKMDIKGCYQFDLVTPFGIIKELKSGIAGKTNAENAVAASSLAFMAGLDESYIRKNLATFEGVERRFDFQINTGDLIYVDDYAHHPEELKAFIGSMRDLFPGKRITGVFQPHLFSRTRDFAIEFAKSLEMLDELILLEIYPAREEPIEGISSQIVFEKVSIHSKSMCSLENLVHYLSTKKFEVLLTMGAGSISQKVNDIKLMLSRN